MLNDEYILVQVNTSSAGLSLPKHLTELPSVTLKLSRLFRGSMTLNDSGISADLLFNGAYFTCILPLDSIWACSSASGTIQQWDDSVPAELLAGFISEVQKETQSSPTPLSSTPLSSTEPASTQASPILAVVSEASQSSVSSVSSVSSESSESSEGASSEAVNIPQLDSFKNAESEIKPKDSLKESKIAVDQDSNQPVNKSINKKPSTKKPHPFLRRIK